MLAISDALVGSLVGAVTAFALAAAGGIWWFIQREHSSTTELALLRAEIRHLKDDLTMATKTNDQQHRIVEKKIDTLIGGLHDALATQARFDERMDSILARLDTLESASG